MLISNPTSKYLSLAWNFGSLLGVSLVVQLITGLLLTFYYSNEAGAAFASVDYICREVHYGWLIRILHVNGASLFFGLMFLHIFKNLFFARYRLRLVWIRGFVLLVLRMAIAFLGYVLPNAQMSYWACVVITSLLTVLPGGSDILLWVWGGYSVNAHTLKVCFRLHYLLPWVVLLIVLVHVILLHEVGRTTPLTYRGSLGKIWFYPSYWLKDAFGLVWLLVFYWWILLNPYALTDPEIFIEANFLVSPLHIVPEWYFLPYYAILRAQPVKVVGVLLIMLSLLVPAILCLVDRYLPVLTVVSRLVVWWFIANVLLLGWLGQCPVEEPFTILRIICTSLYFIFMGLLVSVHLFVIYFFTTVL